MKTSTIIKFFLGILIIASATLKASPLGDSLIIYNHDKTAIINGKTDYIMSTNPDDMITYYFQVQNNTGTDLTQVHLKKTKINMASDAIDVSVCMGMCYAPFVDITITPVEINAGSFYRDESKVEYSHYGNYGKSLVKFDVYDSISNPKQIYLSTFYVEFNLSKLSVDGEKSSFAISGPTPNPASNIVRFDYNLQDNSANAQVIVRNTLGQQVISQNINPNEKSLELNISSLHSGMYFCTFLVNGKVQKTTKLIVK